MSDKNNVIKPPESVPMSADSVKLFHNLASKLTAEGRLRPEDIEQLAIYCRAIETYAQASDAIKAEGIFVTQDYNGRIITKRHPGFDIQTIQYNIIKHASKQFGLSPYDRKLVDADPVGEEQDNEFDI